MSVRAVISSPLAAGALGAALGTGVTVSLHRNPRPAFWGERLGSSNLRYANIPVGGMLFGALAGVLALKGKPAARPVAAFAAGAGISAVGTGFADPLPPTGPVPRRRQA